MDHPLNPGCRCRFGAFSSIKYPTPLTNLGQRNLECSKVFCRCERLGSRGSGIGAPDQAACASRSREPRPRLWGAGQGCWSEGALRLHASRRLLAISTTSGLEPVVSFTGYTLHKTTNLEERTRKVS